MKVSMTFEIFPTKKYIPKCDEIIRCSRELFLDFLKKELIERDVEIISQEVCVNKEVHTHPVLLTLF